MITKVKERFFEYEETETEDDGDTSLIKAVFNHFFGAKPPDFSEFKTGFDDDFYIAERGRYFSSEKESSDDFLISKVSDEPMVSQRLPSPTKLLKSKLALKYESTNQPIKMSKGNKIKSEKNSKAQKYWDLHKKFHTEQLPESVPPAPIIYSPLMRICDIKTSKDFNKKIEELCLSKERLNRKQTH